MSIKNNTTSLQDLLEQVNSLPEAENLDTEILTQSTLLSEQDAKIAELAEILAGKASGSGGSGNDIETYDLIIQSDGITKLQIIKYVAYVNGEYQYHSDTWGSHNEYPITISNVVLKAPVTCHVDGGVVETMKMISNIDYLNIYDYNENNQHYFYYSKTFLPLNSDNGQIIIRCFDDD